MDICDPAVEAAYYWLGRTFLFDKETIHNLTWRVSTTEVYSLYKDWLRQSKLRTLPIEDIWGIIQLAYPFVKIVGGKGDRSFTGMRIIGE
jgi:hypothetical protein